MTCTKVHTKSVAEERVESGTLKSQACTFSSHGPPACLSTSSSSSTSQGELLRDSRAGSYPEMKRGTA